MNLEPRALANAVPSVHIAIALVSHASSPTHRVAFQIFQRTVALTVPSPERASEIARMLPEYVVPGYSGDPEEHLHLREDSDGWILEAKQGTAVYSSLTDAITAAEHLVVLNLLLLSAHVAQVHAAGAATGNGAVLAIGKSGAGKSSIAVQWSLQGYPAYGDDIVFIDDEWRAAPFKRLFKANPSLLRELGEVVDPTLERFSDDEGAYWDPRAAAGWAEPTPIATIAIVQHEPDHRLEIDEIPKTEALRLMLGSLMPSSLTPAHCFDRLAAAAAEARTLRVVFGNAGEAAAALATPR